MGLVLGIHDAGGAKQSPAKGEAGGDGEAAENDEGDGRDEQAMILERFGGPRGGAKDLGGVGLLGLAVLGEAVAEQGAADGFEDDGGFFLVGGVEGEIELAGLAGDLQ